jgi:hypothetical protein
MDSSKPHNPQTAPATNPGSLIYPAALIIALALLVVGIVVATRGGGFALLAAGGGAVVAVFVTWPLATIMFQSATALRDRQDKYAELFAERMEQISVMLNLISEQQLLSDRAKSVAFREKDREALRRAIQEEIHAGDYEAAYVLADDMEKAFGYKQEADRLRDEIRAGREAGMRKQIGEVVNRIDGLTRNEQWSAANAEAENLQKRFPEVEQVRNLPAEIENRKQQHKKALIDSWNDAVARHDVDGSIEILKKLDLYLSPGEADAMQETVRSVFKEKINQLRTQFSLAVQDHQWTEAIRIGETIMRDFPNSKIAEEVKGAMDGLRKRAAEPAAA